MNQTSKLLHKIADNSNGKMRVVPVPDEMRVNYNSLIKLENEIFSQVGFRNIGYKNYVESSSKKLVKKI